MQDQKKEDDFGILKFLAKDDLMDGIQTKTVDGAIASAAKRFGLLSTIESLTLSSFRKWLLEFIHSHLQELVQVALEKLKDPNVTIPWLLEAQKEIHQAVFEFEKTGKPAAFVDEMVAAMYKVKVKSFTEQHLEACNASIPSEHRHLYSRYHMALHQKYGASIADARSQYFLLARAEDPALFEEKNIEVKLPLLHKWLCAHIPPAVYNNLTSPPYCNRLSFFYWMCERSDKLVIEEHGEDVQRENLRCVHLWCNVNQLFDLIALWVEVPDQQWETILNSLKERGKGLVQVSSSSLEREEQQQQEEAKDSSSSSPISAQTHHMLGTAMKDVLNQLHSLLCQNQKDLFMPFCYHLIEPHISTLHGIIQVMAKGSTIFVRQVTKKRAEEGFGTGELSESSEQFMQAQIQKGITGFREMIHLLSRSRGNPLYAEELLSKVSSLLQQFVALSGPEALDVRNPSSSSSS